MPANQISLKEDKKGNKDVQVESDSDDSVIHVPYVKPTPPVVSLIESDEEIQEPTPNVHPDPVPSPPTTSSNDAVSVPWEISTEPSGVEVPGRRKKKKTKKKRGTATNPNEQSEIAMQKKSRSEKRLARSVEWRQKCIDRAAEERSKKKQQNKGTDGSTSENPKKKKKKKRKSQAESQNQSTAEETSGENRDPENASAPPDVPPAESENSRLEQQTVVVQAPQAKTVSSKRKSRSQSESTGESSSTPDPKKKRTKRKTLTAADLDHLNFLKTLNLTGNIGFDENDMLNMALSPADFTRPGKANKRQSRQTQKIVRAREEANHDSDTSSTTISSDVGISRPVPQTMLPGEALGPSRPPDPVRARAARASSTVSSAPKSGEAFVTVTEERDSRGKKKRGKGKSPVTSPSPSKTVLTSDVHGSPSRARPTLNVLESPARARSTSNVPESPARARSTSNVPESPARARSTSNVPESPARARSTSNVPESPAKAKPSSSVHESSIRSKPTSNVSDGLARAKTTCTVPKSPGVTHPSSSSIAESPARAQQNEPVPVAEEVLPLVSDKASQVSLERRSKKSSTDHPQRTPEETGGDEEGVFTHQELDELQSSIRLNITGLNVGPHSSHARHDNGDPGTSKTSSENTLPSGRKSFRYFDPEPSSESAGAETQEKSAGPEGGSRKKRKRNDIDRTRKEDRAKKRKGNESTSSPLLELNQEAHPPVVVVEDLGNDEVAVKSAENSQDYGSRSFPSTWTEEMKQFYGVVRGSDLDVREVVLKQNPAPHLWRIPKDKEPQRRQGRKIKCHNCNQYGYHLAAECPEPRRRVVCIMCGNVGHKTDCMYNADRNWPKNAPRSIHTVCRRAMCLNCGRRYELAQGERAGKFIQSCWQCHKAQVHCDCCGSSAHKEDQCPDHWRRFHSTIADYDDKKLHRRLELREELQKTVYRPKFDTYCSNCGRKGHNYYQCDSRRDFNAPYATVKPYVIQELPLAIRNNPSATVAQQEDVDSQHKSAHVGNDVEWRSSRPAIAAPSTPTSDPSRRNTPATDSSSEPKDKNYSKSDERRTSKSKNARSRSSEQQNPTPEPKRSKRREPNASDEIRRPEMRDRRSKSAGESSTTTQTDDRLRRTPSNRGTDKGATPPPGPSSRIVAQEIRSEDVVPISQTTEVDSSSAGIRASDPSNVVVQFVNEAAVAPGESQASKEKQPVPPEVVVEDDDSDIEIIEVTLSTSVETPNAKKSVRRRLVPKKKLIEPEPDPAIGKCKDFPDCQNPVPPSGPPCFKIILTRYEHSLLLDHDREHQIVERLCLHLLHSLKAQNVSISLRRKEAEFHIGGSQYYYARDRLCRLIKDVTKERDVVKLLPELFPPREPQNLPPTPTETVVSSSISEPPNAPPPSETQETESPKTTVEKCVEENAETRADAASPANPTVAYYDFEKRLRKLAVRLAHKPAETATASTESPASPDPQPVIEGQVNIIPDEEVTTSAEPEAEEGEVVEEQVAEAPEINVPFNDFRQPGVPKRFRPRYSRGRGRNRFSQMYPPPFGMRSMFNNRMPFPRRPPPGMVQHMPYDIDERVLPVEERTRADPFQSPYSPFAPSWFAFVPVNHPNHMMPPRMPYPQNFEGNDFCMAVSTPDGFIMDRQFFADQNGPQMFNPGGPAPRPRFHPN